LENRHCPRQKATVIVDNEVIMYFSGRFTLAKRKMLDGWLNSMQLLL